MTDVARVTPTRARPGAFVVAAAMLATLPIVGVQGPLHTAPVDLLNGLFVTLYWGSILARRERLAFPLLRPFWLIMVGSLFGLFSASEGLRAVTAIGQELYLFVWFVTVVDFLRRYCRLDDALRVWTVVAGAVALLTVADLHFNVLGGALAGADGIRAAGSFANPNMYGDYLVISFFLALTLTLSGHRVMWVSLPVLLMGILSTASNGAMLSFTSGMGATAVAYYWHLTPRQRAAAGGVILLGAAGMVVLLGGWWDVIENHALTQMSESRGEIGGAAMKGFDERFPLWLDAIESVRHTPTGVGPANFNRQGGLVSGDFHAAHNEYLGMLSERGPIGLIGWLGILLAVTRMVGRIAAHAADGARTFAPQPLYGLVGAIAAHAGVVELFHFRHVWMAFAVVAAAAASGGREHDEPLALAEAA